MNAGDDNVFSRWSRRKLAARQPELASEAEPAMAPDANVAGDPAAEAKPAGAGPVEAASPGAEPVDVSNLAGPAGRQLNWGLNASTSRMHFEQTGIDYRTTSVVGSLNWVPDIDWMLGVTGGWDFITSPDRSVGVFAEARGDIANGHGWLVTPGLRGRQSLKHGFGIGGVLSTTWASEDYMADYFGIDADDAQRSGLSDYDADAGIKDVSIAGALTYRITERLQVGLVARYARLLGDAADSPIVPMSWLAAACRVCGIAIPRPMPVDPSCSRRRTARTMSSRSVLRNWPAACRD